MDQPASTVRMHPVAAWVALGFASLGVLLGGAELMVVAIALPSIVADFGGWADLGRVSWIINAYLLAYVVAMPLMGRIADSYGRGRIFALALLLFCVGSAWVAVSNSLTMISIARGVQAIGGGAVVPVSMALVTQHASPQARALGLGAIAAASEAGGLVGPLWGGGVAELLGWRWVFWINLPMCLPLAAGVWWLAKRERRAEAAKLDVAGAVLIANSVSLAMIERRREMGVLKAIGYTSARVTAIVAIEYAFLGLVAGVVGLGAIAAAMEAINRAQPAAELGLDPVLGPALVAVAVAVALASAMIAAWRPLRVRPLEVLRDE